jgi:transposase InsO family protein
MIRDRDRIYGAVVTRRMRAMGIRDKPIAPASPWQNGFAERLIGSIRRECLDHVIVLGEAHLRRVLKSYADYYNRFRTHRSLRMHRSLARYSAPVSFVQAPSWADFITTMVGFEVFGTHTWKFHRH